MFDNIGGHIVIRHEIPIEAMLQPLWDVYVASKGEKYDFDNIHFPSNSHYLEELKSIRAYLKNLLQNPPKKAKQEVKEEIDKAKYEIYSTLVRYLLDYICRNEKLDQSIKESALLIYKQDVNQCFAIMKMDTLESKYIDECNALMTENNLVAKFYSLIMRITKRESFIQDISQNYNCKSFIRKAISSRKPNLIQIYSPLYNINKIKLRDKLCKKRISADVLWLNKDLLRRKYDVQISGKEYCYEIHDANLPEETSMIAIQVGMFVFPLISEFVGYVKNLNEYIWTNILYGAYHQHEKKEDNPSLSQSQKSLLEEFRSTIKDNILVQKLSYLVNNLYLPKCVQIDEKYKTFFSPVLVAKDLKYLLNYEFLFQENDDKSAILATYQRIKDMGITAYNLLHILKKEGDITEDWTGPQSRNRHKMSNVFVLQPVIAFYFLRQFYEEYFKSALCDSGLNAVFNQKVEYGKATNEIDVIVKGEEYIYFVELKTTLSVGHILKYREKCIKWMEACPEIKQYMKFVIAGCYGNDDLLVCANQQEVEKREGMSSDIFTFSIDIDSQKEITCFTEPVYTNLKEKLRKIFV